MTTNTNATKIAAIKASMRAVITNPEGNEVITFSEAALVQMKVIADTMVKHFNFDELKMTAEDFQRAEERLATFSKADITGIIVNNEVQASSQEQMETLLASIMARPADAPDAAGPVLTVVLLADLLNELKQFTRNSADANKTITLEALEAFNTNIEAAKAKAAEIAQLPTEEARAAATTEALREMFGRFDRGEIDEDSYYVGICQFN